MTVPDSSAEAGAGLPPNPAAAEIGLTEGSNRQSGLFGRGLLYVVVFSFQTLAATIVSPVLAHLIGPEEFGRLASAIALYQLLSVLCVLGLDQALVIQRAEDGDSRSARSLIAISFALTTAVVLVTALTSPLWSEAFGFTSSSSLLVATFLWTGPGAAVQVMLSMLLSEDRLKVFTVVSAISAIGGQLVGVLLLVLVSRDATTYAWGGVASQFAAMAIGIVITRPRPRGLLDLRLARRALTLGAPLAVGAIAAFVLNAGDRIVIQRLLGPAEVGRYQVAYTVGYVVVLLMVFVSQAWTPRFAAIRDREERLALAETARNELYRLLLPLVLGISLGAPLALRVFAPASFAPETLTLVVFLVAVSAFPVAASGASGRELITLRRGRSIAAVACIAAVVNIGLNLLLVPRFGIEGSAAATVLAFGLTALLQARCLPRSPRWPRTSGRMALAILGCCLFAAVTTQLPQTSGWIIARMVLGLACVPWLLHRLRIARNPPPEIASAPGAESSTADALPSGRPTEG
ncbi:Membrane protein involved in the export of O-antigen and teichoic acid [Friedmanniella luteola]|uniref:Membrane protein involved in the export of O-antigen and teichoic acid n=1 Tax=Friedmanniella luteola TaxID=546871 RepID=A0A1H1YE84_9ACTN|nr:oligosaccharide flippase family protein [Friedmanniella luteola]SDT19579.1 Membrane protein involved in the export of O-antigen and teichoic acid [Friedmanniella luteola]